MTRILYADNAPEFLDLRAQFLERAGYQVVTAGSVEEARRCLSELHLHLAILDIRLVDDDDDRDTSGLTLAKDPAFRLVPKVILTGFPTYQAVREALGPAGDGLPPAVGFLDKREGPDEMLRVVADVLARHMKLNGSLGIQWAPQAPAGFLALAPLVCHCLPRELVLQRADELEDLFRKLFHDACQVRIDPVLWRSGERLCLAVAAQSSQGTTRRRLLLIGARHEVAEDLARLREFGPSTSGGVRPEGQAETVHFGGVVYSLPDANLETVQTLREQFLSGKDRRLGPAFAHLLERVLPAWHARGPALSLEADLMALYRRCAGLAGGCAERSEVERRFEALVRSTRGLGPVGVDDSPVSLAFRFPGETPLVLPNPVAAVYGSLPFAVAEVPCRISPGRLTVDNLLIDGEQRVWLTDFSAAGPAPQWWDLVQLEASLRFDLSQATDLAAWWDLEECLTMPSLLYDRLPEKGVDPGLRGHLGRIFQIRLQASTETGSEVGPYYAGLLVWAVAAIAAYDAQLLHTQSERLRAAHLLLASGLLARRLGSPHRAKARLGRLRLEVDGAVWAGEQFVVTLVGQELDLLRCLLEHPNELVPREEIAKCVFGEPYSPGDAFQQNRIDSLVTRLRRDVEPDPRRRRYLFTQKRQGYRLRPDGVERDTVTSD